MSRASEDALLLRELASVPEASGYDDIFRLLDAMPKGRPAAVSAPAVIAAARVIELEPEPEPEPSATAPAPPPVAASARQVIPLAVPSVSPPAWLLRCARLFAEVAADLRRSGGGDVEQRITDALMQVRARDPRFAGLSLDRPSPADALGLLYVAEAAIGPEPGRWQIRARRNWRQHRAELGRRLLELYNGADLPAEVADEVELLWARGASAIGGVP